MAPPCATCRGCPQINQAWMWGALLATSITGWLHQLTATLLPDGQLAGHGVRDGQAMIATLCHRLIRIPARLIHHAGTRTLRLPPEHHHLLHWPSSPGCAPYQQPPPSQANQPRPHPEPPPEATLGPPACPPPETTPTKDQQHPGKDQLATLIAHSGQTPATTRGVSTGRIVISGARPAQSGSYAEAVPRPFRSPLGMAVGMSTPGAWSGSRFATARAARCTRPAHRATAPAQ
jgi:hypothetical protein